MIGISKYRDEILVEERQILSHATGLAEVWRPIGTFFGMMTEELSSLYAYQQQSSTASLYRLRFIEDIGISYRYSRYTWENRVFLPVRDPKKWGPAMNPHIEVMLEEQTNYVRQIQPNSQPASTFPPDVLLSPKRIVLECNGSSFYSIDPPIYGEDLVVSVDGSRNRDWLILDDGQTLGFSPAPPNGAVAELAYNTISL